MNTETITLKSLTDFKYIGTFGDFKSIDDLPSCLDGSIGNYYFSNSDGDIIYIGKATEGEAKEKTGELPKFSGLRKRISDYIKMNNTVSKKIRDYRNNYDTDWKQVHINVLISEKKKISLQKATAAGLEIYLIEEHKECKTLLNTRR